MGGYLQQVENERKVLEAVVIYLNKMEVAGGISGNGAFLSSGFELPYVGLLNLL